MTIHPHRLFETVLETLMHCASAKADKNERIASDTPTVIVDTEIIFFICTLRVTPRKKE